MALFERHTAWADQIARSVHSKLPPSFDVDDIKNRCWLGLAEACVKYEAGKGVPFGAFAFRYVSGAAYMAVRRREYTERTHAELPATLDVPTPEPDDRLARVMEALGRLPLQDRLLIVDHYLLGVPMEKCAKARRWPVARCQARIETVIAALRREVLDGSQAA